MSDALLDNSTTSLRRTIYALVLILFAFIQRPGEIVADTKFDLMIDPGRFLGRATQMWDGGSAFGQIQNQAYGYFFPMGPFFWLGEQLGLDAWVTQRLWWSLLLILAFFGLLKVAETLQIGKPWTRVVAAFAYALSVHITTIIGASSVEAWPTALVPWVLWAIMRGTDGGSERRWAAVAGLLTAACGGVNAVAVAVVLPLGACWVFTREGGRRRWVLFAWWIGATLLASLWWLIPLFLMGSYSFPFLDYIENATITTAPTGLTDVLGGSSGWVAFVDPGTYAAGHQLALTPFLIVDAALLAALGVAGLARRDTPHRQFLLLGLLVGVMLLSFGYTGAGSGWGADARQGLLDGALAPLRNLHKFDAVLRLPLVLGLAHMLAVMMPSWSRAAWSVRLWPGVIVLALVGTASPWFIPAVAPAGAMQGIPDYWTQTARYLNAQDDGRTLVVPAAAFGSYEWGTPRDDVLQPLLTADWAVRNVVPLAEPGNVAFLDAVTETLEAGRPSPRLAKALRSNGIARLVVRNDLNRTVTGAPDPVVVHQALDQSPGLQPVASFGPDLGWAPSVEVEGDRVLPLGGLSDTYAAVEVYDVRDAPDRAGLLPADDVPVVAGGVGAALASSMVPGTFLLPEDLPEGADSEGHIILTDTMRRREKAFAAVRDNESATLSAGEVWRNAGREHFHRLSTDQEKWQAVTAWRGVRGVTASSSQAWADAAPPLNRGQHPGAALDGEPDSEWRSARGSVVTDQWWQVDFGRKTDIDGLRFTVDEDTWVTRVRISNGSSHVDVDVDEPGTPQPVSTGLGASTSLRISVLEVAHGAELSQVSLGEVEIPNVEGTRLLRLRGKIAGAEVDGISLNRDADTSSCFTTSGGQVCQDQWATTGEDGDVIARTFELPQARTHDLVVQGSVREGAAAVKEIAKALPFSLETSSVASRDVRGSALAMLDGDEDTTWVSGAKEEQPEFVVTWPEAQRVGRIRLRTGDEAPAARPTKISISSGGQKREVDLNGQSKGTFAPLTGRRFTVRVLERASVHDTSVSATSQMPVGVGELSMRPPGSGPNLVAAADRQVRLPCGQGPAIDVNGSRVETRVEGTVAEVLSGKVVITACASSIDLDQGTTQVITEPTDGFRLDHVDLYRSGVVAPTPETETPAISEWSNHHRTLEVAGSEEQRLLLVPENFNPGWVAQVDGEQMESQRVGGWQQAWVLPAGASGEVELTFTPQSSFIGGLIAGGLALLALLGLALVPVQRRVRKRPAASAESTKPVVWFVLLPVAGLVAGWAGFALAVLGFAATRLGLQHAIVRRDWSPATSLVCAVLVTSAGAWTAWERSRVESLTTSTLTQLLVVVALVVATFGAGAKGPESLRRNMGRSIT